MLKSAEKCFKLQKCDFKITLKIVKNAEKKMFKFLFRRFAPKMQKKKVLKIFSPLRGEIAEKKA